jgi:hypothetical protein
VKCSFFYIKKKEEKEKKEDLGWVGLGTSFVPWHVCGERECVILGLSTR